MLMISSPLYRPILHVLRVALFVSSVVVLFQGSVEAALIVAVFIALSFVHLLRSGRQPNLFDVLFALAALMGALGYVFDLFGEIAPYDELTHGYTTFAASLAFYFLFYEDAAPRLGVVALGTSVFTLGVTAGAYWEIFEWFFIGKYSMADTIGDLLIDSSGALAAALFALAFRRRGERLT